MAYGNTSVSSLLRAARAAQQKQYALEDSIAAYEYDLSPKSQADFEKYQAHLGKRITQYQGTDPLKALNYQKTITSANRSFTSSELSRATTQVLYGNMDNGTKLNTMMSLYQRAVENGDQNLAQRIEGQAAMLQQTMQRFGGGGGGGGGAEDDPELRGIKKSADVAKRQIKLLEDEFRRGNITLQQMRGGYTDPQTGEQILGIHDLYQGLDSTRKTLEGMPMTEGREKYYTSILDTLKSPIAQNLTGKAGQFSQAGEDVYAKKWNPLTRSWEVERQKVKGYEMSDLGAMLKPETNSKDFINYKSGKGGFGRDKGKDDTSLFPKNAANELAPGIFAMPVPELGGKQEWIVKQDPETGEYQFMGTREQLAADPTLRAEIATENTFANLKDAPGASLIQKPFQNVTEDINKTMMENPALQQNVLEGDLLGSALEYGKTKATNVLRNKTTTDLVNKALRLGGQFGFGRKQLAEFAGGLGNLPGLNMLQRKADEFKVKIERRQAEEAEAARVRAAIDAAALRVATEQARRAIPKAAPAPYRQAPQFSPSYGTVGNVLQGFTSDEFSKKGIGTNSLYRL